MNNSKKRWQLFFIESLLCLVMLFATQIASALNINEDTPYAIRINPLDERYSDACTSLEIYVDDISMPYQTTYANEYLIITTTRPKSLLIYGESANSVGWDIYEEKCAFTELHKVGTNCTIAVAIYVFPIKLEAPTEAVCNSSATLHFQCPTYPLDYPLTFQVTNDPSSESSWKDFVPSTRNYLNININTNDLPSFNGVKYGVRHFRVKNSGAIIGQALVTFGAPPPTITILEKNDPLCHNGNTGSVTVNITPNPLIDNFSAALSIVSPELGITNRELSLSQFPTTFTNLNAENYIIKITNKTNTDIYGTCASSTNFSLNNPTKVQVDFNVSEFNGYNIKCKDGNTGEITAIGSGGKGGYKDYKWSSTNQTTQTITGLTKGTYTVTLKDANNCVATGSVTLTEPPQLTVEVKSTKTGVTYPVSCWYSTDGQIEATASGGIPDGYTYMWNTQQTESLLKNLPTGTYTVTATDKNKCTAQGSITLTAPDSIDFKIKETQPRCPNTATGSLEVVDIKNNAGPFSFEWSTNPKESTALISNKPKGLYSVTVTYSQNCKATRKHRLTDPPANTVAIKPITNYNGAFIRCKGGEDGILAAEVKDYNNNLTTAQHYEWFKNGIKIGGAPSLSSIDNQSEGNYRVVITYGPNSCTTENSYFLNDPDAVQPIITIPSTLVHNGMHISCPGAHDGILHATASQGTGDPNEFTYTWNIGDGINGQDVSGLGSGTYSVTVTDKNGCTGTSTKTLEDPLPVVPVITISTNYNGFPVRCHDSSDAILTASATGGTESYQYVWNVPNSTNTLANVGAGTYSVTITDTNGCSASTSKTIVPPSTVETSIAILSLSDFNGQAISCYGKSDGRLQATASGGTNSFTHVWSYGTPANPLPGGSGNIFSGASAGVYIVTSTDTNGCTDKDMVTLDNPAPVIASISNFSDYNGYGVKCTGSNEGFIEVQGSGGTNDFTFFWPENAETSHRNEELYAGVYSVIVKDNNGCPDTVYHTVTEPDPLGLSILSFEDINCFGGNDGKLELFATGGVSGFEYTLDDLLWRESPLFEALAAGPYTVKVKDLNGCTASIPKTLIQPDKIQIDLAITPAFCADPRGEAIASPSGGVGNFIFQWRDAAHNIIGTSNTISNKAAGIYTITVHDDHNCPMTETVPISTTDGPKAESKDVIAALCSYSSDGSGTVEVTEGDGPFTFLWPGGQTSPRADNLYKGDYVVTIRDRNDCIGLHTVTIPAPEPLAINLVEAVQPVCHGDCNGLLEVTGEGGTLPYNYTWVNQSGSIATNLCAGSHTVVISDNNNCTYQEAFILDQPQPLAVSLVRRILPKCNAGCDGEIEVQASGGNSNYQFTWNTVNTEAIASGLCAGDHTVTVTDEKFCTVNATYSLGEPTPVQVRLLNIRMPTCYDGCDGELNVEGFGGTGDFNYSWNTGAVQNRITELCANSYTITVSDHHACEATTTFDIINPPQLKIDLGGSIMLCTGQIHTLTAGNTWQNYAWGSNNGFSSDKSAVTVSEAGLYWLDVTNIDGCHALDTFLLETSSELLKASFLVPKEVFVNDTLTIIDISWPQPESTFWTFPIAMHKVLDLGDIVYGQFYEAGLYELGLKAFLGQCTDAVQKKILVLESQEKPEEGRIDFEEFVKVFALHPNPNDGAFEVTAEFAEASAVTVSIWNSPTGYMISKLQDNGKASYRWYFDLRPVSSGTYVVRLDHAMGRRYIRFIVR